MKIGILSLAIAENYGGTIQAIALYRLLHSLGHDVVQIYKLPYTPTWKKILKKILLKIPFHDLGNIKTFDALNKELQKRKAFHRPFIETEVFKISDNLYTKQDLRKFVLEEKLDAIIVGSDQVWRKDYIDDRYYKSYFLDFISKAETKKIAYAASFGKDHWEGKDDHREISKLLHDFTAVSTREVSGTQICKETFNYPHAKHVLDPTLLQDRDFYINQIINTHKTPNAHQGGLISYVLDEAKEKKEIIDHIQTAYRIGTVNHLKGFNSSNTLFSVPEWLQSFAKADYIVTDSFHGMVFSIIFQKNFTVIGNESRGLDRFTSLLSLLGLQDRLILNIDELISKSQSTIDYTKVNKILELHKNVSYSFLINGLGESV